MYNCSLLGTGEGNIKYKQAFDCKLLKGNHFLESSELVRLN